VKWSSSDAQDAITRSAEGDGVVRLSNGGSSRTPVDLARPDPTVEAYKRDVDRTNLGETRADYRGPREKRVTRMICRAETRGGRSAVLPQDEPGVTDFGRLLVVAGADAPKAHRTRL
jgi:hypothetical protein